VKMRFSNPVSSTTASAGQDVPVTGQHFLTYRFDRTSLADGTFWIRHIPKPILIVRDQSDGVVLPFEPHMLVSAAHSEGSLVTSVDLVVLPDANPVSLKGHYFDGNEQPLTDVSRSGLPIGNYDERFAADPGRATCLGRARESAVFVT
jgi:hypothetical protein